MAVPYLPEGTPLPNTDHIIDALGGRKALGRKISSLEEMRRALREGLPYRSLEAVAAKFAIAGAELSAALHLPPRTIARRKKTEVLPADESDRLFRLARIAAEAARVLGSEDKAARWLHARNRALGNQTPLSLLDTEIGAQQVEAVLGRVEHGVFS
jgi:putative toxin-antitoxin system antitoxin component (TIGR02293 family)